MHQFAQAWLALIVDISIKSLLLAVVAGLVLFLLRVRDANLRHRVWTAVLIGMLTMPALVYVTPAVPLPGWLTIAIPNASTKPNPAREQPDHKPAGNLPPIALDVAGEPPRVADSNSDRFANPAINDQPHDARSAMQPLGRLDSQKPRLIADDIQTAEQPSVVARIASRVPLVLASLYFAVAIMFVVRLLVGLALTHRLIGQAREIQLVATMRLPRRRGLRMLETGSVHVPATVGFLRPVVLLPMSWRQWSESKLQAVLAHELAHVRRADWLVVTLAELNRAMYWFHPVAWIVRRRLSELAEQNCDDAVLEADGNRTLYAGYLLEVAASLTSVGSRYRPPFQGVAMARKPNVETRIDAILDASRPLARRLGAMGILILLAIGIPAILLAAALRPETADTKEMSAAGTNPKAEVNTQSQTTKEKPAAAPQAGAANDATLINVHGHVLNGNGAPVANAQVVATQSRWLDSQFLRTEHRQVAETRSGADGSFAIKVPRVEPGDFRSNSLLSYAWKPPTILATASGRLSPWVGGGEMPIEGNKPFQGDVVLRMLQPSGKIRGHLVSLEGQSLSGLSVSVKMLAIAEPEWVDPWLAAVERLRRAGKLPRPGAATGTFSSAMVADSPATSGSKNRQSSPYFPIKSRLLPEHPQFPPGVRSDADGRFEINGLPPDSLAILEISGPGMTTHTISVLNRDIERIDVPQTGFPGAESNGYYGAKFEHPVAPGNAIVGTVTDKESGRPLPGVRVSSFVTMNQMQQSQAKWTSETGTKGEFRIEGLPMSGKKYLDILPGADQPYLVSKGVEVPNSTGANPSEMQIKLRRGVVVRGKVTDAETGMPVDATVHYHPLLSNEHAKDYGYDPRVIRYEAAENRQRNDEKGVFRAVVIPGQGILAVQCVRWGEYCVGLGSDKIKLNADGRFSTYNYAAPKFYNRVTEIDVPANAEVADRDLTVSHGVSVTLNVQDPQGEPLRGVLASGLMPFAGPGDAEAATSSLEFKALRPGETRRALLLHKQRRLGRIAEVIAPEKGADAAPRTITLEPCGIVTGRVVDGEGQPIAGLLFEAQATPVRDLDVLAPERLTTDAEGKFRFEYLPPGAVYNIAGYNPQFGFVELSKELKFEPGETIDLGKIDLTSKQRPEPVRTKAANIAIKSAVIARANEAKNVVTPTASDAKRLHVQGRVLGPDGKPVAGATVYAAWAMMGGEPTLTRTEDLIVAKSQSDADGTFELTFSQGHPVPGGISMGWHIAAFTAGFGPAWQRDINVITNERANKPTTLTLTTSQAIDGRFVDLEGNPLAGIKVRIYALHTYESEQAIFDWMADAKKKPPPQNLSDYFYPGTDQRNSPYPGAFPAPWADLLARGSLALPVDAATDRDGRIHFDGLGANQLAVLEIEGSVIATSRVQVVLRDMEPVSAKPVESAQELAGVYYGRRFQCVAGPTQPIVGKVTDAETGKPLPNLEVYVERLAGPLSVERDFLTTRTDEQGRYRLVGAPRGGGHFIEAAPTLEQPYFPTRKQLESASGFDPITCDFALRRGRWIVGKVIDESTNAPPATATVVEYLPLRDNEHAKDHPNYDPNVVLAAPAGRYHTSADGSFRVLAIPGAGILAAIAQEDNRISGPQIYVPLSKDQVPKHLVQANGYLKTYHPFIATEYNALKEVNIPESQDETSCNLQLSRGLSRRLKFVDTQGSPVTGVRVLGRRSAAILEKPANDSSVEIVGLRPNDNRVVVLIQDERKTGKAVTIGSGDELTVELEPCAIARGRVVNDDGKPVGKLTMNVTIVSTDSRGRRLLDATTGDDGRFEALLPTGMNCRIFHFDSKPIKFGVSAEFQPKPGAVFELGDLTNGTKLKADQTDKMIVKPESAGASLRHSESSIGETRPRDRSTIHGRVVGVDGKPAAGVDVAVVASRTAVGRGGDLEPRGVALAEAKTDAEGQYQMELTGVSSKTHRDASLIARCNGTALAWRKLNLDAESVEASFELQPEVSIAGRMVDIEGQPATGVRFRVVSLMARASIANLMTRVFGDQPANIGFYDTSMFPAAWPEQLVADSEGHIKINGIPKDHGITLRVEGSDRFAPQLLMVNTGMSEQRGEHDGTYRPQVVRNLKPGEEAVLPLAPAQFFTGTVYYEDTGEPAPHARLTIWSSQQKFGSMFSLAGKADEKGEYRISANPGIRFGVTAYPPDGKPYLARQKNGIPWEDGVRSKVVDMKLPCGVAVQGKVLEEGSDVPVAGASVQYICEDANNRHYSDDILSGWQDIHLTNEAGRFTIVVLPGPGRLLVHGPGEQFVLQETSGQELYKGRPGGRRNYAHAIEKIDPALGAAPPEIVVRLKRGATVSGEVVNQQGKPIDQAEMFSRLHIDPASLYWRGFGVDATGGRFEVSGLAPGREYPVYFLDSKRRLGATVMIKAGMPPPRVVLEPCGAAKMRFVDDKGKPVAKHDPWMIQLLVTPGGLEYSKAAMNGNSLAADAEYVVNVDRQNHPRELTDSDGRFTVSALIPGATYRIVSYRKEEFVLAKDFQAVANETIDLGDITVERKE